MLSNINKISLDQALDLLFTNKIGESEIKKDEKAGQAALEGILRQCENSKDSNEVADAAQAAYYLGIFLLKKQLPEYQNEIKQTPTAFPKKFTNILDKLFGARSSDHDKAIGYLKQAVELGGEIYSDALLLLALIYKKQNKNDLSHAYLLWAAHSGNTTAREIWQEEIQNTGPALPQEKVKNVPKPESKVEEKPLLRSLISRMRPIQLIQGALLRMRVRLKALAQFKKSRLGAVLRDILGGESITQDEGPAIYKNFNDPVDALEETFNDAIQAKLIERSSSTDDPSKKIRIERPVLSSYLKDVLENANINATKAATELLDPEKPDSTKLTKEIGKIGIKYYYLAIWQSKCDPTKLNKKVPGIDKDKDQKEVNDIKLPPPPKAPASMQEASMLCKTGEKYYRMGIEKELKTPSSGQSEIDYAWSCFKKAADFGYADAFFNLGVLHENKWRLNKRKGTDGFELLQHAIRYYEQASARKCAEASFVLSEIYASQYTDHRHVIHAVASYNYFNLAKDQGYRGYQEPTKKIIETLNLKSDTHKKKLDTTEEKKENGKTLYALVKETKESEAKDVKAGLPVATLITLRQKTKDSSHLNAPKDEDERALVQSLFANSPVSIFSRWSKKWDAQKDLKLSTYISHAQGKSLCYSGNNSYQAIQMLCRKLGVLGDIRKKVDDQCVDAGEIASNLLVTWWQQNQTKKRQEEQAVVDKLFQKHQDTQPFLSGWSSNDKKNTTLLRFIGHARRGTGCMYSGDKSYAAFNAFVKEEKLDIQDIRQSTKTDIEIAEEVMSEISYRSLTK